ncbi:MAG: ABC transporter permease [Pseudolysinimonas sp.]
MNRRWAFATAFAVELRKSRSARVVVAAATILIAGVAALAGSFAAEVLAGNVGAVAKLGPSAAQAGWPGLLATSVQITGAGALLTFGIVVSWMFGREFAEGTISGLFALPVSRPTIAMAKLAVLALTAAIVSVALALAVLLLGAILGFGTPAVNDWTALGRIAVLCFLSAFLAVPAAWASTLGRGLLPGVAVTVGIMASAQIVVVSGIGAWYPVAAPSLWAISPTAVPPLALALVATVPVIFGAVTTMSWHRLQLDR